MNTLSKTIIENGFIKAHSSISNLNEEIERNKNIWVEILYGNISNHKYITLLPVIVAENLILDKGQLDLNRLKFLSDQAAEVLGRYSGGLELNGLKAISDDVAESLSNNSGSLELIGLKKLSKMATEYLSRHQGIHYLPKEIQDKINEFK